MVFEPGRYGNRPGSFFQILGTPGIAFVQPNPNQDLTQTFLSHRQYDDGEERLQNRYWANSGAFEFHSQEEVLQK
jgi:hypothetical protein